jgi:hypothetical protein
VEAKNVSRAPNGWRPEGAFTFPDLWWYAARHRSPSLPITPAIFIAICFEETACCNVMQGSTPVAAGPAQLQVSDDDKVEFFAGSKGRENFMGGRWDSSQTTWASDTNNRVFKRQQPTYPELKNPLSVQYIMSDNEFSVKMHMKYFQWLMNGNGRSGEPVSSLNGLLMAQTGGGKNAKAGKLFIQGGQMIEAEMDKGLPYSERAKMTPTEHAAYLEKRRAAFAAALLFARVEFKGKDKDGNAIGGMPVKLFPDYYNFLLPDGFLEDPRTYLVCGF